MNLIEIKNLIPECCTVDEIDINKYNKSERRALEEFLPAVKSIIVLGHHIRNSREWVWTPMKSERENCTCIADLHTKDIMKKIKNYIKSEGYNSKIIPYPGVSGIRFKKIAMKTKMGEIGDNFLFLHKEWGPWVHLRVLVTNSKINSNQETTLDEVCIHCAKCIKACPVNAIGQDSFNKERCNTRQEQLEVSHSCEICARSCPIGETPEKIKVVKAEGKYD